MNISEVMTSEVRVASPEDTLQCVASVMEEEDFGSLPIAENDRLASLWVVFSILSKTNPSWVSQRV